MNLTSPLRNTGNAADTQFLEKVIWSKAHRITMKTLFDSIIELPRVMDC